MKRFCSLVFAFIAAACLVLAQDAAAALDQYVRSFAKPPGGFMGSVLVATGGKVILAKGYGYADVELDVPNTPQTKFRLGSITKQFTAAAILQLQEQGKLNVQDHVSKYYSNAPESWKDITIRHLLTHTSGIHNFTALPDYVKRMRERVAPLELIARFRDLPLDFPPGSKFSYSNSGYEVLGYIIEKVSGETYEEYLKKHIFDPLALADTGYDHTDAILKGRAMGYETAPDGKLRNAAFLDMSIPYSAGSLYSTVLDLYKWDRALYAEKVLSKQSKEQMFTPFLNNYAYGWFVRKLYDHRTITHNGGINGFATHIARFPDDDACVVVLSNLPSRALAQMTRGLEAILFGQKPAE